jgi:hypothetical protein
MQASILLLFILTAAGCAKDPRAASHSKDSDRSHEANDEDDEDPRPAKRRKFPLHPTDNALTPPDEPTPQRHLRGKPVLQATVAAGWQYSRVILCSYLDSELQCCSLLYDRSYIA